MQTASQFPYKYQRQSPRCFLGMTCHEVCQPRIFRLRDAEAGKTALAKEEATKLLAAGLSRDEQALAALALARAGDTAQAQKLADNLDQMFPLDTLMQRYTPGSVVNVARFLQKWPRIQHFPQNVCISRSIFQNRSFSSPGILIY
jgi:hypothetical protein